MTDNSFKHFELWVCYSQKLASGFWESLKSNIGYIKAILLSKVSIFKQIFEEKSSNTFLQPFCYKALKNKYFLNLTSMIFLNFLMQKPARNGKIPTSSG